ncbi:hypothetical protein ABAC460_04655 [Asticcacaulis sp. AC460]|uniref:hypothetical protein n=1 Tax=Asticcacaulis sp. AC460 TaxID=1282360 RepID=UPI0003C4077E|nr:hypothetical protein [Asticcacaulis sp. AC460]ESQ92183.1 hypothetical protein ABAC460_04655 [Asticcacaulis sp. AC460]
MKLAKAAAAALPFVLAASVAMAETKNVPAEKLFPFLKTYYDLPANQRDQFTMGYFFLLDGVDRNSVSMVLKGASGDRPLNIAANGRVLPLPAAADLKAKREIALTAPKDGKIGIDIRLIPNLAPAASMEAAPLAASVKQAHDGAKKAAGLLSLAVPDYKAVCFEGAHSGTVATKSGKSVNLKLQTSGKTTAPCFFPADVPDAARITLDRAPTAMYIVPKQK